MSVLYSRWHTGVILLFLLTLDACISLTIAPHRMPDDLSGQYDHIQDGVLFQSEELTILEITAEELYNLTTESDGVLGIWAPWDPMCWGTVNDHVQKTVGMDEHRWLVSTSYDIPNLGKMLNGQTETAYVLSYRSFGRKEVEKLKGLSLMLTGEAVQSIPQFYHFDHGIVKRLDIRH